MSNFYKLSIMQDRDRTELYLGAKTSRTLVDSSSIHPRPLGKAIRQYVYLPWAAGAVGLEALRRVSVSRDIWRPPQDRWVIRYVR